MQEVELSTNHRGVNHKYLKKCQGIAPVKMLDNLVVKNLACGHQVSYVALGKEIRNQEVSWADRYIVNEIAPNVFKRGYLYMYLKDPSNSDDITFTTHSELSSKHDDLPLVSMILRHGIENFEEKLEYLKNVLKIVSNHFTKDKFEADDDNQVH